MYSNILNTIRNIRKAIFWFLLVTVLIPCTTRCSQVYVLDLLFPFLPQGSWKMDWQCSGLAREVKHGEVSNWSQGKGTVWLTSV